jgi:hypothetical protein
MSELLCCVCENPNNVCGWSVLGLKPLVIRCEVNLNCCYSTFITFSYGCRLLFYYECIYRLIGEHLYLKLEANNKPKLKLIMDIGEKGHWEGSPYVLLERV